MTTVASPKTFIAGEAIADKLRVTPTAATTSDPIEVSVAGDGATDPTIGVVLYDADAGDEVAVQLWGQGGTIEAVAAGAIGRGAAVYGAAAGKVSTTISGDVLGYAGEAAAADGDIIEIIPA